VQQPEDLLAHQRSIIFRYEVKIYNCETKSMVANVALQSQVRCLLWSKVTNDSDQSQNILAGLHCGQIAIIKLFGCMSLQAQLQSCLNFHEYPVRYLKESPDGLFMTSVGEDEILFVWKHIETHRQGRSSN
jgi:hypothetical protein